MATKNRKSDASTLAYKAAVAKLVQKHSLLKIALVSDVIGMAAVAEAATGEIELLSKDDDAPQN